MQHRNVLVVRVGDNVVATYEREGDASFQKEVRRFGIALSVEVDVEKHHIEIRFREFLESLGNRPRYTRDGIAEPCDHLFKEGRDKELVLNDKDARRPIQRGSGWCVTLHHRRSRRGRGFSGSRRVRIYYAAG